MKIIKYLLISFICITHLQASDVNVILAFMAKTYGGKENLKKLNSYKQVWQVNAISQNIQGIDNREVILPHSLKTTLIYPNKTESRVLTPTEKYKIFNGKKELVSGMKADAMMLQLKRLYSPLTLIKKSKELKVEDFKTHYALVLESNTDKVVYFVDKRSFAITQVTGFIEANGQTITFNTLYTVFKKFDGVLMPTKEYKSTNNIQTAILTLVDVDLNYSKEEVLN